MTLPRGWGSATVEELSGPSGLVTDGDWVESKDQDTSGDVRLTQLADVGEGEFRNRSRRFMNRETAERLRCTYLKPQDILIARMPDPIGRACVFPGLDSLAVTAVDVMIWRTDAQIAEAKWFMQWINSPEIRALMTREAGGTTRQRIAGGRIKEIELPVPPLAEQRRIVTKLNSLTARIARARAELDRVSILASKMRQQILSEVFEGFEGEKVALSDILQDVRYGTSKKCNYGAGPIPVLRIPNVQEGKIDLSDLKSAEFDVREISKLKLNLGDVLVIRSNGSLDLVGRCAVVEAPAVGMMYAGYLIRLRPDTHRLSPKYLKIFLSAPHTRSAIERAAKSTSGVNNINAQQLQSLIVPLPDLEAQDVAIKRVEACFARADRLEAEATRALALLNLLQSSILAKAFRGELVPQDPNDEPASVLLERIRAQRAATPKSKRGRGATVKA